MASGQASFATSATTYGRNPTDSYYLERLFTNLPGDLTVAGNLTVAGDIIGNTVEGVTGLLVGAANASQVKLSNDSSGNLGISNPESGLSCPLIAGSLILDNGDPATAGHISGVTQLAGTGASPAANPINVMSPLHCTNVSFPTPDIISNQMFIGRLLTGSCEGSTPQTTGQSTGSIGLSGFTVCWGAQNVNPDARISFPAVFLAGTLPVVTASCAFEPTGPSGFGRFCNIGPAVTNEYFDVHVRSYNGADPTSATVWWIAIGTSSTNPGT